MSTLKVNTINASTSGQGVAVDLQNPKSFRRINPNGAMNVAQRKTATADNSAGAFLIDRWKHSHGGADEAPTYSQHALTSSDAGPWEKGFRNSFHIQNGNQTGGAGADDFIQCETRIEADDIAQSGWEYTSSSSYVTLSFWVKSSEAQAFPFTVQTSDGSPYRYTFNTGSLSVDTWTKVTKTIPGNSNLTFNNDTGVGLYIYFWPYMGTTWTNPITEDTWFTAASNSNYCNDITTTWWLKNDATFELTGVQLEVGEVATDFEHRSYQDELTHCMRYFQRWPRGGDGYSPIATGYCNTTAKMQCAFNFPDMRAAPSETYTGNMRILHGNSATAITSSDDVNSSKNSTLLRLNVSGTPLTVGQAGVLTQNNDLYAGVDLNAEI